MTPEGKFVSSFLAWRRSLSQENVLLVQASDEVSGIWENNVLLVPVTLGSQRY